MPCVSSANAGSNNSGLDRHRARRDYVVPYKKAIPSVIFGLSSQIGEKPRIAVSQVSQN
jgi:hypothetical protein